MVKKELILAVLASVFLISLASADLAILMPNIALTSGVNQAFIMTMQNTYNFSIFNFTFSNLQGFSFPSINLAQNSNQSVNFNVIRTGTTNNSIVQSTVSFQYLVNIPQGIHTYQINITEIGGFVPNNITIRQGDTIIFKNLDSISREVYSSLFDYTLTSNQTFSYTFNNVGNFPYQDLILFFGGNIRVINQTELVPVNNPAYNIILPVTIQLTANPTTISITNSQNNYTINATEEKSGYLILTNNGNLPAQNIRLSSDLGWVTFDSNNINLNLGASTSVNYHIRPIIYETSATNTTNILNIKINGDNINETAIPISVFIPYDGNFANINTDEGAFALYMRICSDPINSHLLICNNTITSNGNGSNIVQNAMMNLNLTQEQFLSMLRGQRQLVDTTSRQGNSINGINQQLSELFEIKKQLNESLEKQIDNETTINTWQIMFIITLIVGGFFIALNAILKKYATYNKQKSILDAGVPTK